MREIRREKFTGERSLFCGKDLSLFDCTFSDGESPLKESENIVLDGCSFLWKYPLWYSKNVRLRNCTLADTARAGIWYTTDVQLENCVVQAPKTFRRSRGIKLCDVLFSDAAETLWACEDVSLQRVTAKGDYFAMNVKNATADDFRLVGNYAFDGARDVTVRNAVMLTKDAFWNCKNVTVYDSFIAGEYFGWNAENVTLVNCTVQSLQGMCYMQNLVMQNCKLADTTLAFEYSTVQAEIEGKIDSVKNPSGGKIVSDGIDELIMEEDRVDVSATQIVRRDERR